MQHNNSEFLNITHRILCGFVVLILLFTFVATPMKVDASAVAVAIGAAGSFTPVGLGVAAVALLIALTGAIIANSSDLAIEAESVYGSLDPSVQSWMDSTGKKLAAGGETISFVIPQTVINNFNNNYNKDDDNNKNQLSPSLPYVALGADQLLQLDQLNPLMCLSSDATGLLSQGVSLLAAIALSLQGFQYKYESVMIDTRVALNNSFINKIDSLYDQLHLFSTNMTSELVGTRTTLNNTLNNIATPIYNAINGGSRNVATQIIDQGQKLVDTFNGLSDSIITGIETGFGNISSKNEEDQLAILPNFSFTSLRDSLTSIFSGATSFFDDSGGNNGDDDEESYPLIPPISNYFDKAVNPFLDVIRDSEFMAALEAFFSFVASLWLLFPLAIRYLISFGFGVPMTFSVIKMFMG